MEPDVQTADAERWDVPERPAPWRARAGSAALGVLGVLAVVAWSAMETRSADGNWILAAAAVAVGVAVLAALSMGPGHRLHPGVALGLAGVVVVGIASGALRPRRKVEVVAPDGLSGEGFLEVATWWPGVVLGCALVLAGVVLAAVRPAPTLGADLRARARAVVLACVPLTAGLVAIVVVWREVATYGWISGRPSRHRGRRVRPATVAVGSGGDGPVRWWSEAAADEAASIAAFEDLASRLVTVGAPEDLVERARAAARDEVRHARICTHLARAATDGGGSPRGAGGDPVGVDRARDAGAGRPSSPWAAGGRRVAIVGLAVESLADGVVGEGFAAARLRAGASTAADPAAGARLRAMARDEERHAALGADITGWCRSQSPRLVGAALRRVATRLPAETSLPASQSAADPAVLRAAGMVDRSTAQVLWDEVRAAAVSSPNWSRETPPGGRAPRPVQGPGGGRVPVPESSAG